MTGRRVVGGIGVAAIAFGGLQVLLNWRPPRPSASPPSSWRSSSSMT